MGSDRASAFLLVFELMLLLEHFCKSKKHAKKDMKRFEKGIPYLMATFANTLGRTVGTGWKFVKFHLPIHFVLTIRSFGSMDNTNAAIGEMFHKTEVKDPARSTQRRKENFEKQTGNRYVENLLISRAEQEYNSTEKDENDCEEEYKRKVVFDSSDQTFKKRERDTKKLQPCHWEDTVLTKDLTDLLIQLQKDGKLTPGNIELFTQYNVNHYIYRGDPCYDINEPWYDWSYVNWGGSQNLLPCKMLIFLDLTQSFLRKFEVGTSIVAKPGIYALGYSINEQSLNSVLGISRLVRNGDLNMKNGHPELCMFSVESIVEPCVAAPCNPEDHPIDAVSWLFLRPREQWYSNLLALFIDNEKEEKESKKREREENERIQKEERRVKRAKQLEKRKNKL